MLSSALNSQKPHVVIVGGSFAGLKIAHEIHAHARITLIDPKDYFEYTPGMLHLLAGSKAFPAISSVLSDITPSDCNIIQGYFIGFHPTKKQALVLSRNSSPSCNNTLSLPESIVPFDYDALVLCTGSPYAAPIRPDDVTLSKVYSAYSNRVREISKFTSSLESTRSILLVGGGIVGVEFAAEFVTRLPGLLPDGSKRKVTLVTRSGILDTLPLRAGKLAKQWLESKGVKILSSDEIENITEIGSTAQRTYTTKAGLKISADLFVDCTGRVMGSPSPSPSTITISSDNDNRPNPSSRAALFSNYLSKSNTLIADLSLFATISELAIKTKTETSTAYVFNNLLVDEFMQSVQYPRQGVYGAGDGVTHSRPLAISCSCPRDNNQFAVPHSPPYIRNANLAGYEAEVCAYNLLLYLKLLHAKGNQASEYSSVRLRRYPEDCFLSSVCPLSACVSLGPNNALLIMNDFVLGGPMAALAKFVIERSKVAEIRGAVWGRLIWRFVHVAMFAVHWLRRAFSHIRHPNSSPDTGTVFSTSTAVFS